MSPDEVSSVTQAILPWSETALLLGAVALVAALWLDKLLGEPSRFHPLVGFGRMVVAIESGCRKLSFLSEKQQGVFGWWLAVVPPVLLCLLFVGWLASLSLGLALIANALILYFTLGGKSLIQHADNIYQPLRTGDLESARFQVSMIVSRNTKKMSEKEIVSSTVESVLENGNDAVFAPMFWFILFGAPGAVLLRLANTLDAMWGYKNQQYLEFGWFSAKTDDLLGYIPARITAVVYAFQGNFRQALWCWKNQAGQCASPNGGVVMTTGAGSLNVCIGGPTYYHGVLHDKKPMGCGDEAEWPAIFQANRLVTRGSFALGYIWLISVLVY